MEKITKWEYKETRREWAADETQQMKELGKLGWELVSVCQELAGSVPTTLRSVLLLYTYKRPIQKPEEGTDSEKK